MMLGPTKLAYLSRMEIEDCRARTPMGAFEYVCAWALARGVIAVRFDTCSLWVIGELP